MSWWGRLLRTGRMESELEAELRDHLERVVARGLAEGLSETEARRRATLEFGRLDAVKEDCRDARGTRWAADAMQDVRYAGRLLRREWSFSALVVGVLGLGLGVTTTFFTLYYTLTIRGLPIAAADRVVWVDSVDARARPVGVSHADFLDLRRGAGSLEGLAAISTGPVAVRDDELAADRFLRSLVTADAFSLLRERPARGRGFASADDRPGATPVAILSDAVWRDRYGADPGIVGREVHVDGVSTEIVAVMEPGFRFPARTDLWQPLGQHSGVADQPRDLRHLSVFGRLRDGASVRQASTELAAVGATLAREYPETNRDVQPRVRLIDEQFNGDPTMAVWVAFMTAGVVVLLVACANVANLLLMRAVHRTREIAMRRSLGASRSRVVRQMLAESTLLALIGGLAGLAVAALCLRLVRLATPDNVFSYADPLTFDLRVYGVMAAVSLGTVLVFGLVPALFVSRTGATGVLKDGGHTSTARGASRWTTVFLSAEFGLTLILVVVLAQGVRDGLQARQPFVEIDPADLLTAQIALPPDRYDTPAQRVAFYDELHRALDGLSGVTAATLSNAYPTRVVPRRQIEVEGREPVADDLLPEVGTLMADGAYFDTLGVGLSRGRAFTPSDGAPGHEHAIVSERLVEVLFPDEEALGRRVRLLADTPTGEPSAWFTIVGVAPVIRQQPNRREPTPLVYLPLRAMAPVTLSLIVRGGGDPATLTSAVREAAREVDADLPLYRPLTLERAIAESEWNPRLSENILLSVALIALGLSAVGLYGVTAHAVARRTPEIGVRMALGAGSREVVVMVLRSVALRLAVGAGAGLVCLVAWARTIGAAADPGPGGGDWWLTLVGLAVLVVTGVTACLPVVYRATRIEPMRVLRTE